MYPSYRKTGTPLDPTHPKDSTTIHHMRLCVSEHDCFGHRVIVVVLSLPTWVYRRCLLVRHTCRDRSI